MLFFLCIKSCTNAPQYYVTGTLPVLLDFHTVYLMSVPTAGGRTVAIFSVTVQVEAAVTGSADPLFISLAAMAKPDRGVWTCLFTFCLVSWSVRWLVPITSASTWSAFSRPADAGRTFLLKP